MDPRLVVRARGGDERAFEALTTACHPRFFRLAYGILRQPLPAEEAVQQAFIDIWRYLRRLRDPARFEAWAFGFVVEACRAEAKRQPDEPDEPDATTRTPEPPAAKAASRGPFTASVDREQIGRGFVALPFDHRGALVLRHLLGASVEDIGMALGVSASSAAARLEEAVAGLRATLDADAAAAPSSEVATEGAW